jgi:hypothetical protein
MEQLELVARYRKLRSDLERTRFDNVVSSNLTSLVSFLSNNRGSENLDNDISILDTLSKYSLGEAMNIILVKHPNFSFIISPDNKLPSLVRDKLTDLENSIKKICKELDKY